MAWEDVIKVSFDEFMSDERVERVKQTDDEKYLASLSPQEKKKVLEVEYLV